MVTSDKIITLEEAAELLKISKPTVYRKVKSGEIPARKVGRGWRFLKDDILNLLRSPALTPEKELIDAASPLNINEMIRLCKKHYIGLCYLFGSHAAGTADSQSDIDIGIVFLPNVNLDETGKLFSEIRDDFTRAVKGAELDLIFLQSVGPLVCEQAISGDCIYSVCDFFRTRYEDMVNREAMDFRFFQRRFDKEMIEDIKEGRFFAA